MLSTKVPSMHTSVPVYAGLLLSHITTAMVWLLIMTERELQAWGTQPCRMGLKIRGNVALQDRQTIFSATSLPFNCLRDNLSGSSYWWWVALKCEAGGTRAKRKQDHPFNLSQSSFFFLFWKFQHLDLLDLPDLLSNWNTLDSKRLVKQDVSLQKP